MNQLKDLYAEYLKNAGRAPGARKLGVPETALPKSASDTLALQLAKRRDQNMRMMWIAVGMLVILFGLGVYFAILYRNDVKIMASVFGGTFLTLMVIVRYLHKLWKDISSMDVLIILLPNMTPAEVLKAIETLYYSEKDT